MRLVVPVLALVFALPASAQLTLDPPADGADVVDLFFGWEPGMRADVRSRSTRVRDGVETGGTVEMALTVRSHPDGLLLDYELTNVVGAGISSAAATRALDGMQSDLIVTEWGELIDLANYEELVEGLDRLMGAEIDSLRAASPEADQMMAQVMSREFMLAASAQTWNAAVGTWDGAQFEIGEPVVIDTVEPFPLVPGATIPMRTTFLAEARVPCVETETEARCVRLSFQAQPDEDAVREVISAFLERLSPSDDQGQIRGMFVTTGGVVVTEPETLRPHRVELHKRVKVEGVEPDGSPMNATQTDRKVFVYTYR